MLSSLMANDLRLSMTNVVFNNNEELGEHCRQFHRGKGIEGTSRNAQERASLEDEPKDDIATEEVDASDCRRNEEPVVDSVVFQCNECTYVLFNSRDQLVEHRCQFHKGKAIAGTSRNAQEKAFVEDEDDIATDGDE
ncbi:unnamed protein product [Microthlaspi erraticum]|uniref:Uncharacterized protein n=1 Tax=Microthlaspi erraticum TaxID=1685480 RepID=A0A6D2KU97_9BRAS|nr:unnamed protein product [Microthlaspi erraticum]